MIRTLFTTLVALFLFAFSYGQTVTFLADNGLPTKEVCKGTGIQLDLTIDPPIPVGGSSTYNVQWVKTPGTTFIMNCPYPSPGGTCSFINDIPLVTTTYTVTVNGGPAGSVSRSVTVTVDEVPNPGLDTTIFLCGKAGVINLFDELDGGPEPGGTWSNGTGTYNTADTNGGAFTYTIAGSGVCPPVSVVITVKPCGNNDADNDGVPDTTDDDKDNDGIPNTIEDSFCTATTTTPIFVLEEDFGFGDPTRSRYSEGLGLTYNPLLPQDVSGNDGEYNVATSTHYRTNVGFDATFLATDLIGDIDANGDMDGRYLAINMKSSQFANKPVFVAKDLPVTPGLVYDFSMSIASLNNNVGELPANLTIEVVDQVTGIPIFSQNSGDIANGTDNWILVQDSFTPTPAVTIVTIRVINNQNTDGNGNDIGIDNVFLSTNACDFDRDGIPNSEDLDADNDGIYDIVEAGNSAFDTNGDGRFDGPINTNGTSTTVTHNILNSDSDANQNFLDIDADNDGIVDNIEGQSTAGYIAPSGVDGDFNGVDDSYDTNGTAIIPENTNTTPDPDYIDTNADPVTGDCLVDTIEAYDTNQDGTANVVAIGSDTDADGLDDAFDTVVLDRLTGGTNANNGGTVPTDFPNNHNPLTDERDWREEIGDVDIAPLNVTLCVPVDLFDELPVGTLTTGTWSVPTSGTALTGSHLGTLDPSITGILDGVYVYTLPVLATGCSPIRYLIDVTINNTCRCPDIEEPVVPTTPITTCINATPLPSVTVTLAVGLEGRWYLPDGTTPIARAQNTDTFTPTTAELLVGTNIFKVEAYEPVEMCTSDLVDVIITVTAAPEAGVPNDTPPIPVIVCVGDTSVINLFDELTGEDTGGVWTDPMSAVVPGGTISAATNIAGDYIYTVSGSGCTDTAVISVVIETVPNPGTDGTLNTCNTAPSVNLIDSLGTPDSGGSWTAPNGASFGADDLGTFDPSSDIFGIYTYTVGSTTCNDTAIVEVILGTGINSGAPTNPVGGEICLGNPAPVLSVDVLANQSANWYTEDDILLASNTTTYTPVDVLAGDYIYLVESYDIAENCPSDRIEVLFSIQSTEEIELISRGVICVDLMGQPIASNDLPYIDSFLSESDFSFEWSLDGVKIPTEVSAGIEASQPGEYSLIYTDLVSGCSDTASTNIVSVVEPQGLILTLSNGTFAENNDIIATVDGDGEYEYSLDGGSFQDANVFTNVSLGPHTVTVSDINGCGVITNEIFVIGFPKFFTPNNDGENDSWNVIGDEDLPDMAIFLFDKYGKLLVRLVPDGNGWDGTYNGRNLPSSDYWFAAKLVDGTEAYRGHFSLVR